MRNSHLLGAYSPERLRQLKDGVDGWVFCYGSGTLVRALLADGLVDELHLFLYPVAVGSGPRLFPEDAAPTRLALGASESYGNGVVHLTYTPPAA